MEEKQMKKSIEERVKCTTQGEEKEEEGMRTKRKEEEE